MGKFPMKRLTFAAAASVIAWALAAQGATAQSAPINAALPGSASSDDIGADGLKRRGDGSIDDSQPGVADSDDDIGPDGLKRRGDGSMAIKRALCDARFPGDCRCRGGFHAVPRDNPGGCLQQPFPRRLASGLCRSVHSGKAPAMHDHVKIDTLSALDYARGGVRVTA